MTRSQHIQSPPPLAYQPLKCTSNTRTPAILMLSLQQPHQTTSIRTQSYFSQSFLVFPGPATPSHWPRKPNKSESSQNKSFETMQSNLTVIPSQRREREGHHLCRPAAHSHHFIVSFCNAYESMLAALKVRARKLRALPPNQIDLNAHPKDNKYIPQHLVCTRPDSPPSGSQPHQLNCSSAETPATTSLAEGRADGSRERQRSTKP
jgi:hypothetical protein